MCSSLGGGEEKVEETPTIPFTIEEDTLSDVKYTQPT